MYALGLREQLGGIILSEEDVVDDGCDLNPQPLGKLSVLYAKIWDSLLLLDLGKQLC